ASLHFLLWLMADEDCRHLFLIGAYRNHQISPSHPLNRAIEEFRTKHRGPSFIELGPLGSGEILQLCAETLHKNEYSVADLAELVFRKTGGNPFHIKEFLRELYIDQLLDYDPTAGCWRWDLEEIRVRGATENVVELLAARIQKLPGETQGALKLASCIGNRFNFKTVANIMNSRCEQTLQVLWPALAEDLIFALGDAWKCVELEMPECAEETPIEFKFCHDRVQQAAYSLIPDPMKPSVHLRIGRLLLSTTESDKMEESILEIVDQLNRGIESIDDRDESAELAELNLRAGRKAKSSTAYDIAYSYFITGIRLIGPLQEHNYRLFLDLHDEAVEAAYLTGDFAEMEALAETVLTCGKTVLDKVRTYETLVLAHVARSRPLNAIKTALPVLADLGVRFPPSPNKFDVLAGFLKTRMALFGKRTEDLANLPAMESPTILAAMRISSSISAAAYIAIPELFLLITFQQLRLSMRYGNAIVSPFAYANYGLILCSVFGELDRGYQFGKMAVRLVDDPRFTEVRAKTYFIVNTFITHFKDHIRGTLPLLLDACAIGIQNGDLEFASYATTSYGYNAYCMGKPIAELEKEMALHSQASKELKQEGAFNHKQLYRQAIANLAYSGNDVEVLSGEHYDEVTMLPILEQTKDSHSIANLYFLKLHLSYLFGKYHDAIVSADKAEKYLDNMRGFATYVCYHFFDSLARLAVYRQMPRNEQWRIRRRVARNQRRMKKWARSATNNYLNKYCLVEAERLWILDENDEVAQMFFERAIELSAASEYIHEEALANELTGRFHMAKGNNNAARAHFWEARYCYERWGARAKIKQMHNTYQELLTPEAPTKKGPSKEDNISTTFTLSSEVGKGVDLRALMKASQAISEEIVLEKLLRKLMQIMMENAGAERGFLILEIDHKLLIEAHAEADGEEVKVGLGSPIEWSGELSSTIVRYVKRTRKTAVLDEAAAEGPFSRDPYIVARQPLSVLCTPLLHQGKLSGILYLENNCSKGAFTQERVEVLNLLSSHAAISINT
ncbi:MAG: GAF domain-containing protein, partial [Desulforhabdus sp.]|nr:GAF domain-containing protein [Desulforhabdus sp.]